MPDVWVRARVPAEVELALIVEQLLQRKVQRGFGKDTLCSADTEAVPKGSLAKVVVD